MDKEKFVETPEFIEEQKRIARELNRQFEAPVYHRYPQPSPERYISVLENDVEINFEQMRVDFGTLVTDAVFSIVAIHEEIQDMNRSSKNLSPEEEPLVRGIINAKNGYLQNLSNTVSNFLDTSELLRTLEDKKGAGFVTIESNHNE